MNAAMSDTLSTSSPPNGAVQSTSTPSENDEEAPTTGLWTKPAGSFMQSEAGPTGASADEPDGTTSGNPQQRQESKPERVHHPADPYASRIHIPSGRPLATFAKRFTAYLIDGVVFGAFLLYLEFWIRAFTLGTIVYEALNWALAVYYVLLVGGALGQTPGMRAMKIAVRDFDTGKAVGYRNAAKRTLVMWAGGIPFEAGLIIDCLFPLWDKNQQSLHDRCVLPGHLRRRLPPGPGREERDRDAPQRRDRHPATLLAKGDESPDTQRHRH